MGRAATLSLRRVSFAIAPLYAAVLAGCADSATPNSIPVVTTASTLVEEPGVTALSVDQSIPLRVLAVRPNNPSLAVIDLEEGTVTVYPPGVHALPLDATGGAVMTPRRQLIVWTSGVARLFSGSLDRVDEELGPNPPRSISGIAPSLRVVPTPAGDKAWLVQPGIGYGTETHPTLIELVEIPRGRRLLSIEADANAFPVAATGNGLVLNTERLTDTGDGWVTEPGSEHVLHLQEGGGMSGVGPGRAIATSSTVIVRLVCASDGSGCELRLSNLDGSEKRIVPKPVDGEWGGVGGPGIPSEAMPLQTVSREGIEVLMAIGQDFDVNGKPAQSALLAVRLEDGATRTLTEFEGPTPLATWSHDGAWVALLDRDDIELVDATDPERTISLRDVIPHDHFPLAAG